MPGIPSPQLEPEELEQKILHAGVDQYALADDLALLRVYSFSPDQVNVRALSAMLIKAMLQLPAPDVHLMLHMIPERLQDEQPVAALVALTQHLEGARYTQFWQAVDMCRDTLKVVPGFQEAVRDVILGTYARTCRSISRAALAESLRLDSAAVDHLVEAKASQGWKSATTDSGKALVCFPASNFNTLNTQQSSQDTHQFRLDEVAPLLANGRH